MDKAQQERHFSELALCLRRAGFTVQPPEDSLLPVEWSGQRLCWVNPQGSVLYKSEDVADRDREQALQRVTDITKMTSEYMRQMERAPELKATGLDSGYKLLGEFNDVVLAGRQTQYGVNFITWTWDRDHTSLSQGHYYMEDYTAAKLDFAVRSGAVMQEQIFTPEQLVEICRSVSETLESGVPITDSRRKLLEEACSQIEAVVPDLEERIDRSNEEELELVLQAENSWNEQLQSLLGF